MFVSVRAFLSACLVLSQGRNSGGRSLQRDRGRLEFSRVCLRLGPLLNEECSILLIMLLWLMSLSADSGECNKTLLLFGLFAFFNWVNKRAFRSSPPAIHILGSGWHLCVFSCTFSCVYLYRCESVLPPVCVVVFLVFNLRAFPLFSLMSFIHNVTVMRNCSLVCRFYSFSCHKSF